MRTQQFIHLFIHSFTHSVIHSSIHLLANSLTDSITDSRTHGLNTQLADSLAKYQNGGCTKLDQSARQFLPTTTKQSYVIRTGPLENTTIE